MTVVGVVTETTGIDQLFARALERRGITPEFYDLSRQSEWLRFCQSPPAALFWWAKHDPSLKARARHLLYHINIKLGIPVFPAWTDYSHYDDKIAQYLLLAQFGLAQPPTFVSWNKTEALEYAAGCCYPLVSKASTGAGSANVQLLKNRREAEKFIQQVFSRGRKTFFKNQLQKDYVLWQQFLPGNAGDWRLVCLADGTVFGFFRRNRPGGWQASGSGSIECTRPPEALLEGSLHATRVLQAEVMSYDWLQDEQGNWLIAEISTIWGDPDTHTRFYQQSPLYTRTTDGWVEQASTDSIAERLVDLLVQRIWRLV